jgi:hypothetical protein
VFHEDAVAVEHLGRVRPVALEHHGNAGLEQLGRAAHMLDVDRDAVERHRELDGAVGLDGLAHHGALQAQALGAEALALGHRLVGVAEVQRRVGQALDDQ